VFYSEVMPRARTIWRIAIGIIAVLVLIAIGFSALELYVERKGPEASAARAREALAAHRQQFVDDQHVLAGLPFFASRPGNRDAGPLIGPRVRWIRVDPEAAPGSVPGMMLDPTVMDKLGKDWMHAGPEAWTGVDLAWMARLKEYDLWDVDQNSLPSHPRFFLDTEPDSRDLWGWAELRIAKGIHDGAVGPALSEVEELARLCFTTERFFPQIDGLGILGLVRQTRQLLAMTATAPAADRENIPRMKRALFGAIAFARLGTPASYETDFSRIAVGRCAALHDGVELALYLRALLRDTRSADYQHMERLLAAAPDCRLGSLRRRWALADDERLLQSNSWWDRVKMRWIPGSRRRRGEVLVAISEQDWFKQYDKPSPLKAR
jgi:hypothetical protein